jgi:hypothetical protein
VDPVPKKQKKTWSSILLLVSFFLVRTVLLIQSWAQTIEKVSDNRHTENQQPTPDNQKVRNQQQPPTAAPDHQQLTLDNRHPTTDNKQQQPTDTPKKQNKQPATDRGKKKCENLLFLRIFEKIVQISPFHKNSSVYKKFIT